MTSKISIIEIVKHPKDKNCWLSVEENLSLRSIYSDFVKPYDFIDFEGDVFYYDVIDTIPNCFSKEFTTVINRMCIISNELFESSFYDQIKAEVKTELIEKLDNNIHLLKLDNLL